MFREDYAIVLDYLPRGYADAYKKEPVVQALGEKFFSLLELVPKEDEKINAKDKVYIGPDKRDNIKFIRGRLGYERLTAAGKSELKEVVEQLVKADEKRFVDFFNKAGAISVRQHSLELLPSIGKKHMWDIINEREKKQFESFVDISNRVKLMPDPFRVIVERILEEISGQAKYYLFTRPIQKEEFRK